MKKLFVVLSLALAVSMLFGCGKVDTSTSTGTANPPLQQYNQTGSLQGKIMDAITGAPVTVSGLQVYVVMGANVMSPAMLNTDPTSPLAGDFAFTGIPVSAIDNDTVFRVVVSAPGYQPFEGDMEINTSFRTGTLTTDGTINLVGDVYLFPEGVQAGDQQIIVTDPNNWNYDLAYGQQGGIGVPNAVVLVQQDVENNYSFANYDINKSNYWSNNYLDTIFPTGGLYTAMSMTTDANGSVTVPGSKLVLGGAYDIHVEAINFNGELLSDSYGYFYANTVNAPTYVAMSSIGNTATVYATSQSNANPGTITATGVLSIVFNQPIITTGVNTTLTCPVTISGGYLTVGTNTQATSDNVVGVFSSNNTVLTFSPVITAGTVTSGAYLNYNLNGCSSSIDAKVDQYNTTSYGLGGILNIQTGQPLDNAPNVNLMSF